MQAYSGAVRLAPLRGRKSAGNGKKDIDPIAYFQRFALNTSLTLNYGTRIDGNVNNELLVEICDVANVVQRASEF